MVALGCNHSCCALQERMIVHKVIRVLVFQRSGAGFGALFDYDAGYR